MDHVPPLVQQRRGERSKSAASLVRGKMHLPQVIVCSNTYSECTHIQPLMENSYCVSCNMMVSLLSFDYLLVNKINQRWCFSDVLGVY